MRPDRPVREREEAEELFEKMMKKDSRATTSTVSQMRYSRLVDEMIEVSGEDPMGWDLAPIEKLWRLRHGEHFGTVPSSARTDGEGRMPTRRGAYTTACDRRGLRPGPTPSRGLGPTGPRSGHR